MSDDYRNALAEGTVLDTYRIERVLGEGGFGVTYLVTELNLGKEYAIKELIPDGVAIRQGGTTVMARSSSMEEDFEATRRHFIKEARVLATLKHPAIVAVHRLFEANGTCYMVMDYVEGETLGAYLKRQGGMLGSRAEFEGIFYPLMDGLALLHGKDMIHRDIKPGNIMVTPDGSPVLLDFGASCRVENHTVTVTQMVSAGYSPFEQYTTRAKQGPYTDIYALGATMVRAITGAKPDDATDRMIGDTYSSLTARSELVPVYGLELLSALDASVMVKIEERPQTVRDWRKLIEAVAAPAEVELPESPNPQLEERVSEPAPSKQPLPTIEVMPTTELPEATINGGFLDDSEEFSSKLGSSAKRITVGVIVGVFLLVLIPLIVALFDRDKGNQTTTANLESSDQSEIKEVITEAIDQSEIKEAITRAIEIVDSEFNFMGIEVDSSYYDEIDREILRVAAEGGDARAQYVLGDLYARGIGGVEEDDAKAVHWTRLAANQGNARAQTQLGVFYANGSGVSISHEEAVKWYRKSANQGHPLGELNLGLRYYNGAGVEEDGREALKWIRKAAEKGSAVAQKELAVILSEDDQLRNVEESLKWYREVAKWYRKVADQGYAPAQTTIGLMYDKGVGVPQDDAEAAKWYRKAADQGDSSAQNALGLMYGEGNGVPQDDAEAVKWYRKAAKQDFAKAQHNLGLMYDEGRGVDQDDAEAVKWYRKAADQGNASAQTSLGLSYWNGEGVENNNWEAVKWFLKAANQDDAEAQAYLGYVFKNGKGATQSYPKALAWFRKAADQDSAIAQNALGLMYDEGNGVPQDDAEAVKWFRKAGIQGYARAQYNLGLMYEEGEGVAKSEAFAEIWYRKAADQDYAPAQTQIGLIYSRTERIEDDMEAVSWFRKAAERKDPEGEYELGMCYLAGRGVGKDKLKAVTWFRRSADQGYYLAEHELGNHYRRKLDNAKAVTWYRKAAKQGYALSQYNLGIMYFRGLGVDKDDKEAEGWWRAAANRGNESARKALLDLGVKIK